MAATFNDAPTKTVQVEGTDFAYRVIGDAGGPPIVLLHHFTGVLDDWDPAVIDGLAPERRVIIFDNRGVGRSQGKTPDSVEAMAKDAIAFIGALGFAHVGTGPAGGKGTSNLGAILQDAFQNAAAQKKHPKHFLFFSQTKTSQAAADAFLARLQARKNDRDPAASNETTQAQSAAIIQWGKSDGAKKLSAISHPVLVANGDNDIMVPTINSVALFQALPNAKLSIFPDAGHGGIFQYHREFTEQALRFFGT